MFRIPILSFDTLHICTISDGFQYNIIPEVQLQTWHSLLTCYTSAIIRHYGKNGVNYNLYKRMTSKGTVSPLISTVLRASTVYVERQLDEQVLHKMHLMLHQSRSQPQRFDTLFSMIGWVLLHWSVKRRGCLAAEEDQEISDLPTDLRL